MWPELLSESLADTELQFDAQAFFDDYMSTGETSHHVSSVMLAQSQLMGNVRLVEITNYNR